MTTATATATATAAAVRTPSRAQAPAATEGDSLPSGLKIILFLLVAFAANAAYIVYLASQMPH